MRVTACLARLLSLQLELRSHWSVEGHLIVSLCLCLSTDSFFTALISLFRPLDTEVVMMPMKTWKEETKWRRLWRRESIPWCVHTHSYTHTTLSLCPSHLSGLDLDQRKQLLSLQAWWRLDHGDMYCSLKKEKKRRIKQSNRRVAGVWKVLDYFT